MHAFKMADTPCVILTGGQSKRMQIDQQQTNKALLPFGKFSTLLAYQFDKMSGWFEKVYISSKKPYDLPAPYLLDSIPDYTPLAGLVSALSVANPFVVVIPVDMPFISWAAILKLYKHRNKAPVIYPQSAQNFYLCSVWHKDALATLQQENPQSIRALWLKLGAWGVAVGASLEFSNLNTYKDYLEALQHLKDIYG
ncbi:NTP transferase domain-containing protein [Helicobacter bizzozeronii]|uniref:NTP transferase domain-containing protein n=1 Tax=Helicobacter bizzozeronii TaxID=56877 RepID=UPI001F38361D|nr:NTP transferase domain-containing protein [Helicobacter bizzozeronii]